MDRFICFWEKVVTVRKPHECWGCKQKIHIGERSLRSVMKWGGGLYVTYICPDCRIHLDVCEVCEDAWQQGELDEGGIRDCDVRLRI